MSSTITTAACRASARRTAGELATLSTPRATRPAVSCARAAEVVTSTTVSSPLPCSAWARRSAATQPASAVSSARMTTSLGPASRSTSTRPRTCRFASATYAFPGPAIFATAGMLAVPKARAATACAPPTRTTRSSSPTSTRAAATAGLASMARGGVATRISRTPATRAGIAFISTEDG